MALFPAIPAIGKAYFAGKGLYVLYKAHQNGWDLKEIGKSLLEDGWAMFGLTARGARFVATVMTAYDVNTLDEALAACRKLDVLLAEIKRDGSLVERYADRLTDIERRFDLAKLVSLTSAAHGEALNTRPHPDPERALGDWLIGLYLYGRNGCQFSVEELERVYLNGLSLLEKSNNKEKNPLIETLKVFPPANSAKLWLGFDGLLKKMDTVLKDDPNAVACILYALDMEGVDKPEAVSGAILQARFQPPEENN